LLVEKARSLLEAEANLDELDEGPYEARSAEGGLENFVPASASQSGFSPVSGGRGEPSGLHPRPVSSVESGVFSGAPGQLSGGDSVGQLSEDRMLGSLQGALGAASRNEAGLGSLQRAIRDASRAFTASRQAHEALTEELRVMHRGLNELMSEKAAVERFAALLTEERDAALDAAEEARREAKREREFLLREQDRFIQLLLEEHEAEVQQLRGSLAQRAAGTASTIAGSRASVEAASPEGASGASALADQPPATVAGLVPAVGEQPAEGRKSVPPGEFLSGAALARQALANSVGNEPLPRAVLIPAIPLPAVSLPAVPLPVGDKQNEAGASDTRRSEVRVEDDRAEERAPTYPPAPTVLDLDSLAAEVDGNSERPPPIRRISVAEPKIHLKPAPVPAQVFDTLVSPIGVLDPNRKG
jgi:hypothetical protein